MVVNKIRKRRPPRRDLVEVLPADNIPVGRRKRGQQFRIWINGVEATSVLNVAVDRSDLVRVTRITDPPGADRDQSVIACRIELASPRVRVVSAPPKRRRNLAGRVRSLRK